MIIYRKDFLKTFYGCGGMRNEASTTMEIKKMNRQHVFNLIYQRKKVSKQDIVYELKMSLPTVTQNLKDLSEMGLITNAGTFESTGGRKAQVLTCVNDVKIAIGLDITRNHIGIVAIDLAGDILATQRIRFPFGANDEYYRNVGSFIDAFVERNRFDPAKIIGVGIAVPALISEDESMVVYGAILQNTGETCLRFSHYIAYPCILCHDSEVAGFAEFWVANNVKNVFYISLGNSIGGAVFFDNMKYLGDTRCSGEIGHMIIVPEGKKCYCGQRGCFDTYCAATVLADTAKGSLEDFFLLLEQGEKKTVKIWNVYLDHLSLAIHNTIMLFDCTVILGGYVGVYMEKYSEVLQEKVEAKNPFKMNKSVIKICQYKTEAIAAGAALRHVERFIKAI